jgi:hypothetical protein
MGQGCARIRSRLRRAGVASSSVAAAVLAGLALAASATAGSAHRINPSRVHVHVVTGGPLDVSVAVRPLAAGDVAQRTVTVRNDGRTPVAALALGVAASHGPRAASDALELRVDRCSVQWATAPGGGLQCPGRLQPKLPWRAVAVGIPGTSLGGIAVGGRAWLRVSLRLPANAGSAAEGITDRLDYRFTAA